MQATQAQEQTPGAGARDSEAAQGGGEVVPFRTHVTFPNVHGDQVTSDHGTVVRQSGAVHRGHTRTQAMLPSLLATGLGAAAVTEGRRAHAMCCCGR